MTITYVNGIPATNDNPSTNQPNMQANNDAVPTFVAIDHIGFNVDTAPNGMHAQVTFPLSTSTPTLSNGQTQIFPQTFGSSTTYLETYLSATTSASNQINGYLPFVKALVMFTGVGAGFPATLTPTVNALMANITSVVQTSATTVVITFATALPYSAYYPFITNNPGFSTITAATGTLTLALASGSLSGHLIGVMVI